ncbi:MAG: glucose-6-phosphate isomerase [Caldiserica bacterium]|nr:glucose-6-phosphate isomerase [Caldisericota bacterium]
MSGLIRLDSTWALDHIDAEQIDGETRGAALQLQVLVDRTGAGCEYTGWLDLPVATPGDIVTRIEEVTATLREQSDAVVVCGIGGSYLGARAGVEFLEGMPSHLKTDSLPEILFAGNSLSSWQFRKLLDKLEDRRFSVVVISKSGTTLETAVAFHVLRTELVRRFGTGEARKRTVAITDSQRGTLHDLARDEGLATFDLPRDVGGRYSVLTPVGLLPFAIAGLDIRSLLQGAAEQRAASLASPAETNDALQYAVARRILNASGKSIELLTSFEPCLHYVGEWWKQLFGESEGKDGNGVFPAFAEFTTDLHSLGQFVQEGTRSLFETVVDVAAPAEVTFLCDAESPDGLAYLNGRNLSDMNRDARIGTLLAHHDGGVPVLQLTVPDISESSFGAMVYFFEVACAVGGYMLGINPFDQPGVEAYKRNMFALLGKAGTEAEAADIHSRLARHH